MVGGGRGAGEGMIGVERAFGSLSTFSDLLLHTVSFIGIVVGITRKPVFFQPYVRPLLGFSNEGLIPVPVNHIL